MNFNSHQRAVAVLGILASLLIGCSKGDGKTTAVVTGKVTLDGQPFTQGSIAFVCLRSGTEFSTEPEEDGSYRISIDDVELGDSFGVFIGPIMPEEGAVDADENPLPDIPPQCPKRYREYTTSGFSIVIDKSSGNEFDLELTSL